MSANDEYHIIHEAIDKLVTEIQKICRIQRVTKEVKRRRRDREIVRRT